jgi:hypothetical protein
MKAKKRAQKDPTGIWKTLQIGFIVLTAIFVASWIWHPEVMRVPDELVGEWHTDDANYVGRGLLIDTSSISFQTGDGNVSVGFINSVKWAPAGNSLLYTVKFSVDGNPDQVTFYYDFGKKEAIRFKNQDSIVWVKDATSE